MNATTTQQLTKEKAVTVRLAENAHAASLSRLRIGIFLTMKKVRLFLGNQHRPEGKGDLKDQAVRFPSPIPSCGKS
jgi:hypothetical protein